MLQRRFMIVIACLAIGLIIGFPAGYWLAMERQTAVVPFIVEDEEIRVLATVNGKRFNEPSHMQIVTYEWGSVADRAIFKAKVNPREVYNALIDLGLKADVTLRLDSPNGTKVTGPIVDVYIMWEGAGKRYTLDEVVKDPGGKGFLIRLGGEKQVMRDTGLH